MTAATQTTPQAAARTAALTRAATDKHQHAVSNAEKGIRALNRAGEPVNFRSVARAGGVSVNFLYNNIDLRHRIERLRGQQPKTGPTPSTTDPARTDTNAVIRALTAQLSAERKARNEETTLLRAQLAAAHGELLTQRRMQAVPQRS